MKLFNKRIKLLISSIILGTALIGCSGGGKCDTNVNPTPTITPSPTPGELSLTLTAPDQYPAGMPSPITAYLTMTNTSAVDANNLVYAIPNADNYTGVAISVENGSTQPCLNIPAGKSCTFPAIISAYANPGSFRVTATPNGSSSSISRALLGNTLSLTANIGLTDMPTNTGSGANGISFLYAHKIATSTESDTKITIVGVISSATAGDFNTINLTDSSGNILDFEVLSGNSGNGLTNLVQGSIVTFLLTIPANNPSYSFYAQTMHDGTTVSQGSDKHIISLAEATAGVLIVQPTEFKLSVNESYTKQVITYTNIGNGAINDLHITKPTAPISMQQNNCTNTLLAGSSCTVTLSSEVAAGVSGSGSLKAEYGNSESTAGVVLSQYNYIGANAIFGLNVEAVDGFDFVTDTIDTTMSKQVTITNTGNVSESNFVFTFANASEFTLSSGTSGTSCTVAANTVAQTLGVNDSCTVTLTYTSNTIRHGSGTMTIDYQYNGNLSATPIVKELSYETEQATANLGFNPKSPYRFDTIIANNQESLITVFTVTNNGSDVVRSGLSSTIVGGSDTFNLLITSDPDDCQAKPNLGVGESCVLSVKFGPTLIESAAMTAVLHITGDSQTGGVIDTSLVLNGATRNPLSANPVITNVEFAPLPAGGNGYEQNKPFQIESNQSSFPSVVITYKNTGTVAATDFTVESNYPPTNYTVSSNTCDKALLQANSANSCKLTYQLNTSTVGLKNIPIEELTASWTDETGLVSYAFVGWDVDEVIYSTVYVNVYNKPEVTAILSSESTGDTAINEIMIESNFYAVFKLSGGYQVQNTTFLATAPSGFSPTSGSCVLSSNKPTCAVQFTAPTTAIANQVINFTTTSNIPLNPESSAINVEPASSWYYEGGNVNSAGVGALAFAADGKGRKYVSYMLSDGAQPPEYTLITKTFDGSSWNTICGSTTLKVAGNEGSFDLAVNPMTDIPYVVYANSDFVSNKARATVVKCDIGGNTWDIVGTAGFMGDTQTLPVKIGFAKGSTNPTVVAAVSNNAAGCSGTLDSGSRRPDLKAYTWDGSATWVPKGGCFGYGTATRISLAFNQGGANSYPYIGYTSQNSPLNTNRPAMIAWNGSAWTNVENTGAGVPFLTGEAVNGVSIAFPQDSDTPYFAYAMSSNKELIVQSYDTGNWSNVGGVVTTMNVVGGASSTPGINMAFDVNSNPYVVYAYVDPNVSPYVYFSGVKMFDTFGSASWVSYGTPLPMRNITPGFLFDSSGQPFIAFSNNDEDGYISVVGSKL